METNNTLCIEDIMQQIKAEIKEKNLTSDMLSFEDVPYRKAEDMNNSDGAESDDMSATAAYLNSHYYIQPYKELNGNPIIVFVKKIIRKLAKFYVEPITFEQNEFNANVVRLLNALKNSESAESKSELQLGDLMNRIEILELNQKNLAAQIDMLERENLELKQKAGKQDVR